MRNKKINIIVIIAFILIISVSLYYVITEPINLGLDLRGGTQIILKPVEDEGTVVTDEKLDIAINIIRERIDYLGISEPLVVHDTLNNNIVIQLPGVEKSDRALEVIGKTAQLEFRVLVGILIPIKGIERNGIIDLDLETGLISYDVLTERVLLVDYAKSTRGFLFKDPINAEFYLMDKDFNPNDEIEPKRDSENSEEPFWEEHIIGKFVFNDVTHEMNLLDISNKKIIGELLIDSRSKEVSLVGPILLKGDKLSKSSVVYNNTGEVVVELFFKEEGIGPFADITRNNIGEQLAIVLDEDIKSAPFINVEISDGEAVIEGIRSSNEAIEISEILNIGALPFTLIQEDLTYIGPTLGKDALDKGIYAGIIGLALILIFMVGYYRGLGLISILGLTIYVTIFWGIMAGIGAALTLPGIAGIILTIGMAVDANVIIFARIREEGRKGKSPRIAIGDGFKHALRTIVDANVTTLITAAALYQFGTGPIKGFAVTLAFGVMISMAISLLFTRSVLFLAAGLPRIASPGFIGIKREKEK